MYNLCTSLLEKFKNQKNTCDFPIILSRNLCEYKIELELDYL